MAAVLTINGVAQPVRGGTLRIRESVNARNTMSCEVVSYNGTYRPPNGVELLYTEAATRLFGGLVDNPTERGLVSQMGTRIVNGVNAIDFNAFVDRRHINGIVPAGTLKAALEFIAPQLGTYGVTLDPAQVTGPPVPLLFLPTRLIRDVFDDLSVMTGYVWEIDYQRVLRFFLPGSISAPFNVAPNTDPSVLDGDITVETIRTEYANRILLLAGSGLRESSQTFTGDGVTRTFPLLVMVSSFPTVTVNGVPVTVGTYGVDTDLEWTYRGANNSITQLADAPVGTPHSPLTGADTLVASYTGQLPFTITSDHLAEQAVHGVWEKVLEEPNTMEVDAAQALADAYLTRYVTTFKSVRYTTRRRGIHPGQVQTITVPQRNLSGTFLVTDIEIADTGDQKFETQVTAVGGTVLPGSWRDFYRQGGGSRSGGSPSPTPGVPGGGGAAVALSAPFPLATMRNQSAVTNPSVWMPVVNYIPYTAAASFSGRVRAEAGLRVVGGGVTLRLYNMTDSTVAAVSALVTPANASELMDVPLFTMAITIGKKYRLECRASVDNVGVFAVGVLESV